MTIAGIGSLSLMMTSFVIAGEDCVTDRGLESFVPALVGNATLQGLNLRGVTQTVVPQDVVEQGGEAVVAFLRSLGGQKGLVLSRAKWVLVGRPESGKTSLLRTMAEGAPCMVDASERTPLVELSKV